MRSLSLSDVMCTADHPLRITSPAAITGGPGGSGRRRRRVSQIKPSSRARLTISRQVRDLELAVAAFPPEVPKVIYTTNMIEFINYQLRKITKTRGRFPTEQATGSS